MYCRNTLLLLDDGKIIIFYRKFIIKFTKRIIFEVEKTFIYLKFKKKLQTFDK